VSVARAVFFPVSFFFLLLPFTILPASVTREIGMVAFCIKIRAVRGIPLHTSRTSIYFITIVIRIRWNGRMQAKINIGQRR